MGRSRTQLLYGSIPGHDPYYSLDKYSYQPVHPSFGAKAEKTSGSRVRGPNSPVALNPGDSTTDGVTVTINGRREAADWLANDCV